MQNALPTQPFYPQSVMTPVIEGKPQNKYASQLGQINVPAQPVHNSQYQNYTHISQISHVGFSQVGENTFIISTGCNFKLFPILFFFVGLLLSVLPVTGIAEGSYFISSFVGAFFFITSIYLLLKMYNSIYFVMGPNTLRIVKSALCLNKTTIYNPGELDRIEFNYKQSYSEKNGYIRNYNLIIVPTNGVVNKVFSLRSNLPFFTDEEIGFFLYHINNHIQTNMRI